jgi:hypothetical protein
MRQRGIRSDAYVDDYNWTDTGCTVSPSCLNCPLPVCKYDSREALWEFKLIDRNAEILACLASGMYAEEVGKAFGLTRRTVQRIRAQHKKVDSDVPYK